MAAVAVPVFIAGAIMEAWRYNRNSATPTTTSGAAVQQTPQPQYPVPVQPQLPQGPNKEELQNVYNHWTSEMERIISSIGYNRPPIGSIANRRLRSIERARDRIVDEAIDNNITLRL